MIEIKGIIQSVSRTVTGIRDVYNKLRKARIAIR